MKFGKKRKAAESSEELTIRTSKPGWLARLAKAYKDRRSVTVVDDAEVGIDPSSQTLLEMGKRTGLSYQEWVAVLISLGLTGIGVWMVVAAILDPEPTSKLWLLVAGGTVCVLGGGFSAIRTLTKTRPPSVDFGPGGIRIRWD